MRAYNVTDAATVVVNPGHREFLHIRNVSDTTVYLGYDGDIPTVAAGFPLEPDEVLMLNNDQVKAVFRHGLQAIHNAAGLNKEIRIQGCSSSGT